MRSPTRFSARRVSARSASSSPTRIRPGREPTARSSLRAPADLAAERGLRSRQPGRRRRSPSRRSSLPHVPEIRSATRRDSRRRRPDLRQRARHELQRPRLHRPRRGDRRDGRRVLNPQTRAAQRSAASQKIQIRIEMILSRLHPIAEAVRSRPRRDRVGALRLRSPRPADQRVEGALPGDGSRGSVRRRGQRSTASRAATRGRWPGWRSGGTGRRRRR